MFNSLTCIILGSIKAAAPDFFSSQLFGVIVGFLGSLITTAASILVSMIVYKQQLHRDKLAYERQLEREQAAYIRSLKDAKRERLRAAYKKILNAVETHKEAAQQLEHPLITDSLEAHEKRLNNLLNESLVGVDDATDEITLEGDELDVRTTFNDIRTAFMLYARDKTMNARYHGQVTLEELSKEKNLVIDKAEELKTAMKRHLKELES